MSKTYHTLRKTDASVTALKQGHDQVASHFNRIIADAGKLSDEVVEAFTTTLTNQMNDAAASLKYDQNHKNDHLHTPLSEESRKTLARIRQNCSDMLKEIKVITKQRDELDELEKLLNS